MTWEWAFLLSVACVCASRVYLLRPPKAQTVLPELINLQSQLNEIKEDHLLVHKMAEETKKLLSNQNMALGLRAQR